MSNDDLTADVREALDPTPAHAVEWPVSRRDTLRALAGVGALAVGPSGAQGAAGTGIADAAYFSNYGWESTAEGGVLTIDGAEFTFDGSETIGLPDGGAGRELVTEGGATASEVIGPDGSVLYEAIPDSVVDNFEDADADPSGVYASGETIADYYDGDTGLYSRTTIDAIADNKSLQFDGSVDTIGNIWSHSGLNRYPQKGETFSAYLREPDVGDNLLPAFVFGVPGGVSAVSELSGYGVLHFPTSNEFRLFRVDDSTDTDLETGSQSMSVDTVYEYEVAWHDGSGSEPDDTIEVTLYEVDQITLDRQSTLTSISAQDSTYATATSVGWRRRSSSGDAGTIGDGYQVTGSV